MKNKKLYLLYIVIFVFVIGLSIYVINVNFDSSLQRISSLEDVSNEEKIIYEKLDIQDKYNIKIIYNNSDNVSFYADRYNALIEYDDNNILDNLKSIKEVLNKYEDYVFSGLTIVLFDSFYDNTMALASKDGNGNHIIYLSDNDKFERTMHHELFHILEYKGNEYDEDIWNSFNPENYEYQGIDNLDNRYVYSYEFPNNTYFVTKYSKVAAIEDRAEVFAEVMIDSYKLEDIKEYKMLNNKIEYLFSILEEVK